ncbi:MAG TPA: glycosyltransferase [Pirellulaceae bacterium]|nr:glycosyltransferase [Pirellulaceae bacterium]
MLVEIGICTWNRAASLRETLLSLEQLDIPSGVEWKLIVVDNNSHDQTATLLSSFRDRLPLSVLVEFERGHAWARNRVISASRGELLLWTDDDVRVERNWLREYVRAARGEPDMSFWGGHIEPVFSNGRPRWIEENWPAVGGCFAYRDMGDQPVEFNCDRLPYGANFAVRGDVQRKFLFDTQRGRAGHRIVGGDEIELMRRLLAAGYRGRWLPTSWVWHVIPPERATERYIFRYFEGQGVELSERGEPWSTSRWRLHSMAAKHAVCYYLTRPWRRSPAWLAHLIRWGLARGQLFAHRA